MNNANTLRQNLVVFLISFFLAVTQIAYAKAKFVTFKVKPKDGETLGQLIALFVEENSFITRASPMTQKIFKANPEIKDWRNLKSNKQVTLVINSEFIDPEKVEKYHNKKGPQSATP